MLNVNNLYQPALSKNINSIIDQKFKASSYKLTSGYKLNQSSDDPKDFLVSEDLKTNKNAVIQLQNNLRDSISFLSSFENGLSETRDIIDRMHTITLKAANGSSDETDIGLIKTEVLEQARALDENSEKTLMINNRVFLENSNRSNFYFHYGLSSEEVATLELRDLSSKGLGLDTVDFSSHDSIENYLKKLEDNLMELSIYKNEVGVIESAFRHKLGYLSDIELDLTEDISKLKDTDEAEEMINNTKLSTHQKIVSEVYSKIINRDRLKTSRLLKLLMS